MADEIPDWAQPSNETSTATIPDWAKDETTGGNVPDWAEPPVSKSLTPETDKAVSQTIPPFKEIMHTAGQSAIDTVKGFIHGLVPKTDLLSLAEIAFPPLMIQDEVYRQGKGVVDTVRQVHAADQTPPFSKERFDAGFNVLAQMGMLALGAKGGKEAITKGEPNAIERSIPQMESRETAQRVETRPGSEVAGTGYSDQTVGAAQRAETRGDVPGGEPIAASTREGDAVAGAAQEAPHGIIAELPTKEVPGTPAFAGKVNEPMTVGAASPEEYIQRYSSMGAARLLEGHTELGDFSRKMMEDEPSLPKEQLPQIFERSKQLLNEMQTAGMSSSDISREIKRQTGITKSGDEPVTVKPFASLKGFYAAQEKAGEAGYKRGWQEAAAEGRQAAKQVKDELMVGDKWLSGDQEQVRKNMVEYVNKMLPPDERGRFINAITNAMRRPKLGSDPGIMYKHAFNVFKAIENRAEDVYKGGLIDDIKSTISRASDAPGVDVSFRKLIREAAEPISLTKPSKQTIAGLEGLQTFLDREKAAGRDPGIPQEHLDALKLLKKTPLRDMDTNALEELHRRLNLLEKVGRTKAKVMERLWNAEKEAKIAALKKAPGMPMELRPIFRAQPTEKLTAGQKFGNHLNQVLNAKANMESAIQPTDETFDIMGGSPGTYDSWPSRHIKGAIDLDYAQKARQWLDWKKENDALKIGLEDANFEKMGVKAVIRRIGRERLEAQGVRPDLITKLDEVKLTPAEQKYQDFLDKTFTEYGPQVADMAHRLYQQEVTIEPNYVPLEMDWAAVRQGKDYTPDSAVAEGVVPFDETATLKQLMRDMNPRMVSRTKQGFLKELIEGAKTPVKLNIAKLAERHMDDVFHFINTQRTLKMLSEITRSPAFASKYGKMGQNLTLDFLDTVATNGYVSGSGKIADLIRKNLSKAAVGWRISSNLVHLSNIPYGVQHAGGPHWYGYGVRMLTDENAQAFLHKYGGETYMRAGGEPAQKEITGRISAAGFTGARMIDRYNAQSVLLGRYAKEMTNRGVPLDQAFTAPVNNDALSVSLQRMRRAVASPLAKDVPSMTSRGRMMGEPGSGAKASTFGRLLNQFRNIMLDIYSNVRHDAFRVGVKRQKEIFDMMKQGEIAHGLKSQADLTARTAGLVFMHLTSLGMETGIKMATSTRAMALTAATLLGYDVHKEWKKYLDTHGTEHEVLHHAINRMPLIGPLLSSMMHGETGIPAVDVVKQIPTEAIIAATKAKKPETKATHAIRSATAAASVAGIPGSAQILQILEPALAKWGAGYFPDTSKRKGGEFSLNP